MAPKDSARSKAYGQTRSLANSAMNAIMLLQDHAENRRRRGDEAGSAALILKANDVAREAARIYRAEAEMRNRDSLMPLVRGLQDLAEDGRRASRRIRKLADAIEAAGEFVGVLIRLSGLLA